MDSYKYPTYQKRKQKSSGFMQWGSRLTKCGKDFCDNTSIHGFNHISAPRRLWLERVLWIFACGLAIWGAIDVSLDQLRRFNESPTVVTLEKDFRTWQFSLPAVTCCYLNRLDNTKLPEVIEKYWGIYIHDEKYAYYTRFVNAVASSDLFHLQKFEEFTDMESVDMFQIAFDVMPEVEIKTISSEGSNLKWWPVMTEAGACYVTNSLALSDVAIVKPMPNETAMIPLTCKYSAAKCYFVLNVNIPANFYIHSPYDVMDITHPLSAVYPSLVRVTELSIIETNCGRSVKELPPKRRGCLYTDEPAAEGRQVYSTNTCRLSCRSRLAMKLCNCIPFYYFYEDGPICSPAGMWCLSKFAQKIASNDGHKCSCAPQCIDSIFREISTVDQIWDKGPFMFRGSVKFSVQAPRTRYTREIVFHFQDLVVSFGGAAGLFLGASFISFIEILFFIILAIFKNNEDKHKITAVKTEKSDKKTIGYEKHQLETLAAVLESQKKYEDLPIHFQ